MEALKIVCSSEAAKHFDISCNRPQECLDTILGQFEPDFTATGAVVVTDQELDKLPPVIDTLLDIPTFIIRTAKNSEIPLDLLTKGVHVIDVNQFDRLLFSRQIEDAVVSYEEKILPPFFKELVKYVETGNMTLATPGHHGGQFFRKHPAGRYFYDWFGEALFRSDMSSSDVRMGDLLIHEGAPYDAEKHAAEVFNADFTYFVLNGTSSANKVVCNALIKPGDVVLFDRNNHKSLHHGALVQAGATPVYVETSRNPFGFIGGVDNHCFDEAYLRERLEKVAPHKAKEKRPFRVALIQLGTYDGTIYNARQVVDRIGHLCDYILFDSAWVGYEQFIPMLRDCSPMLLELGPEDPGIFVTQSVHKQLAGLSQASQIHKKDSHIKGQARYCNDDCFNNAFMLHASTSPCYPIFASLDVNAKIHEGKAGRKLWDETVKLGIETRKAIKKACHYIKPFIPETIEGKAWEDYDTDVIAADNKFFKFDPESDWHQFEGYGKDQYLVDPCKLLLYTPGIDKKTRKYEDFGIPAGLLSNYLREHGLTPEKSDLNSILFLITPAETETKMKNLVSLLARFEQCLDEDLPMQDVLPKIYYNNEEHYRGYTIRQLCQEMHDFYKFHNVNTLQKRLFREEYLPPVAMSAQAATYEFIAGNYEEVTLDQIEGRIALEGALPYPPGIITIDPGERWSENVIAYFRVLEATLNELPGFAGEIQGVHFKEIDGQIKAVAYVLKDESVIKK
ncbi:MAG: ornithine decarboxylase [Veillonella caviae]|nr:ornithine decarboxylase [Veillonella caviae]